MHIALIIYTIDTAQCKTYCIWMLHTQSVFFLFNFLDRCVVQQPLYVSLGHPCTVPHAHAKNLSEKLYINVHESITMLRVAYIDSALSTHTFIEKFEKRTRTTGQYIVIIIHKQPLKILRAKKKSSILCVHSSAWICEHIKMENTYLLLIYIFTVGQNVSSTLIVIIICLRYGGVLSFDFFFVSSTLYERWRFMTVSAQTHEGC